MNASTPPPRPFRNAPLYWRSSLVPGADMLTAEYNDHTFAPHWHDAYTFACIVAGAERYFYRGGEHVADAGSIAIIHPGEVHTGARETDFGWRYRVFYLPVDFVKGVQRQLVHAHAGPNTAEDAMPWFGEYVVHDDEALQRLVTAHRLLQGGADPLVAESVLIEAVSMMLVRHAQARVPALPGHRDAVRVETMKARLSADLTEPLSLTALAEAVDLSPFHAARLFSRETGLAPHAWRNQLRVVRALPALRAGASATDVALAHGFNDLSHFTRYFRRAFGVPPGKWSAGSAGNGGAAA
ncbi:AraC family transcriptional regulator [Pandoraea nosoerga]|uniref:AraC family transcriptional regulator n=1 Tax=Pandoraea nosoerga TaxID=2508296 RepID=A0A5E4SMI7_9BURK|nr:AraC family transcriptional regulator [Pandoraea nosoerga]MBN4665297.1 AraC family transcriptional regulator [Pandoraea nosoerga]MBN4674697.1 AraC family transcriptional regulator [Pandoraea nosoerga]MBN4680586.1 AraC family transcriptional regulator [Pandoraea nosoerga]MBN4743991.1 AraC family transcriptional regulator [Pandoraea nosoerga]VVD75099.1 AraC family transcriptional regulator [Pandoraea nosoerga]